MLSEAISYLYRDTDFMVDVIISDDGLGEYIAYWGRPERQPSQAELDAAYQAYLADQQQQQQERDQIRQKADEARTLHDTLSKQADLSQDDIKASIRATMDRLAELDL